MGAVVSDCKDEETQYDLVSVICHHGTAGGKYTQGWLSTRAGSVTPVSRYRDQFTSTPW